MMHARPFILALAILIVAPVPSHSLAAQPASSSSRSEDSSVKPAGRVVTVPGYGTVYVVAQPPKDTRTPRQRCIDEEVAREGGSPSQLAMGAIDLKCSQR
jgi:hypothetical protein